MKTMTMTDAENYVRENAEKLDYHLSQCFAVRGDDFTPKKKFRKSWNNPEGEKPERLPGVCAMFVAENDTFGDYESAIIPDASVYGNNIFLLQGEKCDIVVNDEGEVVLADHKIIAKII